jgi:hypothetical protein
MSNPSAPITRRQALQRLGVVTGVAYCAPQVTSISQARAASQSSAPSRSSTASEPSPPSSPSGPTTVSAPTSASGSEEAVSAPSGCRGATSEERATISRRDKRRADEAVSSGRARPLREILRSVQKQHPGRLIKVGFKRQGTENQYWLKVISQNGRVQTLTVDASTGVISNIKGC